MFFTPVMADDINAVCLMILMRALPSRWSVGHDDIRTIFFKKGSDVLSYMLACIVNASLCCGQFPDCLKLAVVVPMPKKGDLRDIANYRPVALLSEVSKVVERVIADQIYSFF